MGLLDKFKKKPDATPEGEGDAGAGEGGAVATATGGPDPDKARSFFQHAQAAHDSTNFEYAATLWLRGIKWDPDNTDAVERFASSATRQAEKTGKAKGPTKDQIKNTPSDGPIGKFCQALLAWGTRGFEWQAGLKAMRAANAVNASETAYWIGERVLYRLKQEPKVKKESLVELMEAFGDCHGFVKAVEVGEMAIAMDPTDAQLPPVVKNYSASAAMASGSFDESDKEGAYRKRIKDADAQQKAAAEDALVKDAGTIAQQIADATADYQSRPTDVGAITKLARLLRQRGTRDDMEHAYKLLKKGFKDTNLYRLRQEAGDIKLRAAQQQLRAAQESVERSPDDEQLRAKLKQREQQFHALEVEEYEDRVKHYPTDLTLKYQLGRLRFNEGDYEKAIEQFQQAQNAQGVQGRVQSLLGRSFYHLGWLDEAVRTFRAAVEAHGNSEELGMELRYWLMRSLRGLAEREQDASFAQESLDIASQLAIKQINYRDIRQQREEIAELRNRLRQG